MKFATNRLFALVFAALFFAVFAAGAELKIATFNVQNLFDAKNDGSEYKDFVVGKSEWNEKKASAKFKAVSAKIKELNADIIALQEIENEMILKELMKEAGYKYFAFSKGKNGPVGLAVLSRVKPEKTRIFSVPNVKTRDILRLDFEVNGQKFSLLNLHFPARKNSLKQRKTAFITLKSALADTEKVVVLGDFNAPYGDKELLGDLMASKNLANLWAFLPKHERYSHTSLNALDHVLLSKDALSQNYVLNSFKVEPDEAQISDHFALVFRLNFDKNAKNTLQNIAEARVSELSKKSNLPVLLKRATVVQKDKKGFTLAQDKRGIYVYEPKNDAKPGRVMDVAVNRLDEFKGNLEISSHYAVKIYEETQDPREQMLEAKNLKQARPGDVFSRIGGEVRNGRLYTSYGDIKIYGAKGKPRNEKEAIFTSVRVVSYKNEPQIWIENEDN